MKPINANQFLIVSQLVEAMLKNAGKGISVTKFSLPGRQDGELDIEFETRITRVGANKIARTTAPQKPVDKPTEGHTCAVCPKPIPGRILMCPKHWHLVPEADQVAIKHTWRRSQLPGARQSTVRAYRKARDAAIAAVEAQIQPQGDQK